MNKMRVGTLCLVMLAMLMVFSVGCKRGRGAIDTDFAQSPGAGMTTDAGGTGAGMAGVNQDDLLFNPATGLQKVYFDYDNSGLRPDAIATLNENAAKIRQVPNVIIQIEGHCDERGTQEYNLALGERRALTVRDYLISLGVPANRLVTISYGKERPAVDGTGEEAWKFNRRAEFNKAYR